MSDFFLGVDIFFAGVGGGDWGGGGGGGGTMVFCHRRFAVVKYCQSDFPGFHYLLLSLLAVD